VGERRRAHTLRKESLNLTSASAPPTHRDKRDRRSDNEPCRLPIEPDTDVRPRSDLTRRFG